MPQLTPETKLVAAPDQVSAELDGDAAILNLKTGIYYGLDPIGARIWSLLAQPTTLTALRDAITAEYDVTPEQADSDLRDLLAKLAEEGLIQIS